MNPAEPEPRAAGLAALRQRLNEDLERLCLPAEDWLRRDADDPVLDVAIVGGGMSGLAAAAALRLAGVRRVQVFDRQPAGQAGPWVTHARMRVLRSPKNLTGPALGLPSLTFRAWYEAGFGAAAWAALDHIPRGLWQDYLNWYARVLDLPVAAGQRVGEIAGQALPDGQAGVAFTVWPQAADGSAAAAGAGAAATAGRRLLARHLVLATGMDGLGGPAIPALAAKLPRERWQHSSETIDFSRWRGQRVAVVGGGDSALDAAATAAEAGAARVTLLVRGSHLARVNHWKAFTHPGHVHGFAALPPEQRQPLLDFLKTRKVPPSQDTVRRAAALPKLQLRLDSPLTAVAVAADGSLLLQTPQGEHRADHLVFATGYATRPAAREELAGLAPHIRFWSERSPALPAAFALDGFPDLAPDFALREKQPGVCPVLSRIHLFTGAALMSLGKLTGDIPGISHGADRLTRGIVARLYADDRERQFQAVRDYDELEVSGDEWAALRVQPPAPPAQRMLPATPSQALETLR